MNQSFCKFMLKHFQNEFKRAFNTHALSTQPPVGWVRSLDAAGGSEAGGRVTPGTVGAHGLKAF